uniref:C2H2-type domain-containing protein n=1 Tax=Elaeophora elaphi TaxID=1147741 RepID=A0A0R3RQH4_9BILA
MGSQVDIRTSNEYADEERNLSKIQPILQTYRQLKPSKATEPSLLQSTAACDEIKENVADQLISEHNVPQAICKQNNSGYISDVRMQPSANLSQMNLRQSQISENSAIISHDSRRLQNSSKNGQIPLPANDMNQLSGKHCNHYRRKGERNCHSTCSHQISHCSAPLSVSGKRHSCQHSCDNVKNATFCNNGCKRNNYKLGKIDSNETGTKSKKDEITQTSHSFNICQQQMIHCSKPIHQQARSKSNFAERNVYSCQKCTCRIFEQPSRNYSHVSSSSTINAKNPHASSQTPLAPNHHRNAEGRRRVVRVISGRSCQNRSKYDVFKCYRCRQHTFCKHCNVLLRILFRSLYLPIRLLVTANKLTMHLADIVIKKSRSNGIYYYSTCHPHSNDRNHSSGLRHIHYCQHH